MQLHKPPNEATRRARSLLVGACTTALLSLARASLYLRMRSCAWLPVLLIIPSLARADDLVVLRMKNGDQVAGEVLDITSDVVFIALAGSRPVTQQLLRADIRDDDLFLLLARKLPRAAPGKIFELAEWGFARDVHPLLVVTLYSKITEAAEFSERATQRIEEIREQIAQGFLEKANALLSEGDAALARSYYLRILERYPDTSSRNQAERQLKEAEAAVRRLTRKSAAARRGIELSQKKWEEELRKVRGSLKKAGDPPIIHGGSSKQERRKILRHVGYLEKSLRDLESAGEPPLPEARPDYQALLKKVRANLIRAYLDIGNLHLARLALVEAEEWCSKACNLDPTRAITHRFHERLIDAYVSSGHFGTAGFVHGGR